MNHATLPLAQTGQFSPLFLDYIHQKADLQSFYHAFPTPENFGKQIHERNFNPEKRQALHQVLQEQYAGHDLKAIGNQIDSLLDEKTFTVTTGHQLNIFSGPLYVIYKLTTTINLARKLKETYPDCHFVPVYWMATEDHDFAEINHFHLFGTKHTWQTNQTGAVGRMDPSGIAEIVSRLNDKPAIFEKAYATQTTLAGATRQWATELFGSQGLICLDADHPVLKKQFAHAMKADVFDRTTAKTVTETSAKLEALGYKTQVNPRDTNLFYLDGNLRERLVNDHKRFKVLNTELSFSADELTQLIDSHPEKLSPNVLLRPVYQETVLPNLAYVGGPAEIAYWLQLKNLFDALQTPFPILLPRNFALVVNAANHKRLEKTGLAATDLFLDDNALKRKFIENSVAEPISLAEEQRGLDLIFDTVLKKTAALDKSLEGFVGAEQQKTRTSLATIEKRLKKAEEQKQETGIQQLLNLKSKLFPEGGLQERTDNFLNFQLNDPGFLQELAKHFDPFNFDFQILTSPQPSKGDSPETALPA